MNIIKINLKFSKLSKSIVGLSFLLLCPWVSAFADGNSNFDVGSWAALVMQNLGYTATIMQCIQILMGVMLLVGGIHGFSKHAASRTSMTQQHNLLNPMIKFFCGVLLLTSYSWINTLLYAFFGDASPENNPFANSSNPLAQLYEPTLMLVRLVGVGVFMKMVLQFARSGSHHAQPGGIGKGFIYGVSSLLCIHIQTTVQLITSFFGFMSPF